MATWIINATKNAEPKFLPTYIAQPLSTSKLGYQFA